MNEKQLIDLVSNSAANDLSMLNTISKANNLTQTIFDSLVKNKFTFEEALAILTGIQIGFAEAIEKDPSKRNELVKKIN